MGLIGVTITGADGRSGNDSLRAQIDRMNALQRRYPFVEWAFLVSGDINTTPFEGRRRYPKLGVLSGFLAGLTGHKAVHLCGAALERAFAGREDVAKTPGLTHLALAHWLPFVRRVQLNLGNSQVARAERAEATILDTLELARASGFTWPDPPLKEVPVPTCEARVRGADMFASQPTFLYQIASVEATSRALGFARKVRSLGGEVLPFFDASGGRGEPLDMQRLDHDERLSKWLRTQDARLPIGFAGGLGPDTLIDALLNIEMRIGSDRPYWVDMETAVRWPAPGDAGYVVGTDAYDVLDLDKVGRVLALADSWREKGHFAKASSPRSRQVLPVAPAPAAPPPLTPEEEDDARAYADRGTAEQQLRTAVFVREEVEDAAANAQRELDHARVVEQAARRRVAIASLGDEEAHVLAHLADVWQHHERTVAYLVALRLAAIVNVPTRGDDAIPLPHSVPMITRAGEVFLHARAARG